MSGYKASSPYRKAVINPELSVSHIAKLQNLLEQYDRQNQFLNKQVNHLLKRNEQLQRKVSYESFNPFSYKGIIHSKKQAMERRKDSSRFSNINKKFNYTQMAGGVHTSQTSKVGTYRNKEKYANTTQKKQKTIKFTKDPYIQQESHVQKKEKQENTQKKEIKKDQYKSNEASPIKKGMQLMKEDREDKEESKLEDSKLSRKSSRKSGIKIYSKQKQKQDNSNQIIKEQDQQKQKPKFQEQIKPINLVVNEDKARIPNVIFTPIDQTQKNIKYEQKIVYHRNPSQTYVQVPIKPNSQSQANPLLQTQPVHIERREIMKRDSSLNKYERKMSQHKIDPSQKIKYEGGQLEGNKRGQSLQKGKKKFINLVSGSILQKNIKKN